MLTSHDEKLSHHTSTLTDILLNQFTTLNSDEAAVGVMSYCSG
jgi:hypothetical protein